MIVAGDANEDGSIEASDFIGLDTEEAIVLAERNDRTWPAASESNQGTHNHDGHRPCDPPSSGNEERPVTRVCVDARRHGPARYQITRRHHDRRLSGTLARD